MDSDTPNLAPFHPKKLCAKFDRIWDDGSAEQDKDKNVKSLQWGQKTDKFLSEKLIRAFGSGKLKSLANMIYARMIDEKK